MVPNPELLTVTLGRAKLGWFNRLKNSERNCNWKRSLIRVDLMTEKSTLLLRGPMIVFRPAFPNVPGAAGVKAAILNQAFQRLGPLFGLPTALGRSLLDSPLPLGAAPFQNGVIGTPLPRL